MQLRACVVVGQLQLLRAGPPVPPTTFRISSLVRFRSVSWLRTSLDDFFIGNVSSIGYLAGGLHSIQLNACVVVGQLHLLSGLTVPPTIFRISSLVRFRNVSWPRTSLRDFFIGGFSLWLFQSCLPTGGAGGGQPL